ncbi:MAG: zeta toxin [Pseudomonadales bacterium]|jgi:predicted ABC-type ATPase|nr:zeta toxin [Pseudomonadales bacterium]
MAGKRLRVFAGPNGSGKSTIIDAIRRLKVHGRPIDFGIYINADNIARDLRHNRFNFAHYQVGEVSRADFIAAILPSGLINAGFPEPEFRRSFTLNEAGEFRLRSKERDEYLAQALATFLRERLLERELKFSFETVFSHISKVEFLKHAVDQGYKVYLYFVATEDPKINIDRVRSIRVAQGGHDVPEQKIRERYFRSLEYLYAAVQYVYQAYFFDNSADAEHCAAQPFAHFKVVGGEQKWDEINADKVPGWFWTHYLLKLDEHPKSRHRAPLQSALQR